MTEFDYPSLRGHGMIAFDTETHDPNLLTMGPGYGRDGKIAGISIATEKGYAAYIPIGHEAGDNLPKAKVMKWLKAQMALPVPKVGANMIYDLGYLKCEGITPAGPYYDIQIAEPLLNENRFSYGLDAIGKDRVGKGKDETQLRDYVIEKFGLRKKSEWKSHIWRVPPEIAAPYATQDAVLPLQIFKVQQKMLEEDNLWPLFLMESKLIPMLLAMRQRGVKVDLDYAERLLKELEKQKQDELDQIWKLANE